MTEEEVDLGNDFFETGKESIETSSQQVDEVVIAAHEIFVNYCNFLSQNLSE